MINAELALKVMKAKFASAGAYISHVGIALLLIGIVWTSKYSVLEHARLVIGVPTQVLGYTLTFEGREQIEKNLQTEKSINFISK